MLCSRRSPASVGETLRVVRVNNRTPKRLSSCLMVWLSADCETPSFAAALVKLRSCPTAMNASISSSSLLKNPRHSECIVIQFFYHESAGAGMRGAFMDQGGLFSYIAPEARVPANHPLRKIRELVRDVLGELNRSLGKLYASEGRPSIP